MIDKECNLNRQETKRNNHSSGVNSWCHWNHRGQNFCQASEQYFAASSQYLECPSTAIIWYIRKWLKKPHKIYGIISKTDLT